MKTILLIIIILKLRIILQLGFMCCIAHLADIFPAFVLRSRFPTDNTRRSPAAAATSPTAPPPVALKPSFAASASSSAPPHTAPRRRSSTAATPSRAACPTSASPSTCPYVAQNTRL